MFGYHLRVLWVLVTSVAPIPIERIWPVMMFLLGFVSLRNLQMDEAAAFVFAAVVAQVYVIWKNLPDAARDLRRTGDGTLKVLRYGVAATIAASAVQLWILDPVITQRMLSMSCLVYATAMLWGAMGNPRIREMVVPSVAGRPVPETPRTHFLRLNTLAALLVLVVNEALVAAQFDLTTRVSILAILPLVIHVLYEITAILTVPLEES
ncbi:hypothetical protein [Marimonas lutisalis]|uniref:hypothetical protein n=1 Tax=Marimonas lutisalis TaxID=2545756 RepID=UPI0010F53762|nr:hypothetical protein [Marimonas lutisalis]